MGSTRDFQKALFIVFMILTTALRDFASFLCQIYLGLQLVTNIVKEEIVSFSKSLIKTNFS